MLKKLLHDNINCIVLQTQSSDILKNPVDKSFT